MDKAVFCLLVLAGICCSSAEVNVEEFVTTETTPVTETTHSPIVDSTSDSLSDLFPHLTEFYTTTTSTTAPDKNCEPNENVESDPTLEPELNSEPDQTEALPNEEKSSEEHHYDAASSSEDVCHEELSLADLQTFQVAMNTFSKDLLKQIELESQNPNVVVSPFSIALGLFQLALGAENRTEKKILETLHVESLHCLHEKLQKVTKRLVGSSLNVATRMYIKKDFRIKEDFIKKSVKLYGTKPVNLKQSMQQNLEAVNKWVREATRGKIQNFLSNIPSNIVLMLLNAIHFKGIWRNRFDPTKTMPDAFSINDEETVMVDMMQSMKYPLSFFVHDKLDSQVARLPFKGNMSFIVVVPLHLNWNLTRILDKLNRTELYQRFHKEKPTALKVPKLNLDFKLELGHVLSNLGLGELFSNPNLKRISDEQLFVSSVEHQSTLQLKEDGVEAAAATASIMSRSLSTFIINRPFLFFLYDDITGLPLFLGYVRNPKPGSETKRKEESSIIPELKPITKGSIPK